DAVETYDAFVARNPFHRKSPNFHMRVIEINMAGGFPSLVIESKKTFATRYGLEADYWEHFEPGERPEVLDDLKTNLTDLANHYHALYQNPKKEEKKQVNFEEARHWYRQFLVSFPSVDESPAINYQMADLLLENHSFDEAAVEYEKTAYDYPEHEKSSKAGYAAVYAFRQYLDAVPKAEREPVMREAVRSSLQFAETFPEHEKAAVVLDAAAEDLYNMGDHEEALAAARKLIDVFSKADKNVRRSAWLVVAHSTYELQRYGEAESAYMHVLDLLPEEDESRTDLVDNLAASIYKQGEQANDLEDFRAAAEHFLRIGLRAPTSSIRPTAEYDAAAALIRLEDWDRAASVLTGFRDHFPGHELQPEVTKKIAHVYRENGELALAATEYERIERESEDDDVRREALLIAAELHGEAGSKDRMLEVYRRYVEYFPKPVEINLETRNKIAEIFRERTDQDKYLDELRQIVAIESAAGNGQTDRTRYLASKAALVLTERQYERFVDVRLVQPFEDNLRKKQERMKAATKGVNALLDYEIGEVTAAATFYLAEIYAHFSKALMESERPKGLTPLEMEQYELAIEDQAYPFEEKGIAVHERNLELISVGIYNEWIEKSLQKLARSVPARYARTEEESDVLTRLDTFTFASGEPTSTVQEESPDQVAETLPQMASDKSDAVTEGPHGENQ
ncbi:MAG TPA: tetratricopeptide repeat protein, partial [Desulfuromonadales bacterium]|nr:tetratricopeptide repeat protein [Desulfuromonadales bacterium]